jgi:pimeloyl-ACP methyl ester carboxylesterase
MTSTFIVPLAGAALTLVLLGNSVAAEARPGLQPCRLKGVETDALCGSIRRPLDPARPEGVQIDVHYAVLPALARNRKPDPVLFFAGGPGQSAVELAGTVSRLLARVGYRRDIVLIDQRGSGKTAPLYCNEPPANAPLAEMADPARWRLRFQQCVQQLQALPHGDLRHYSTTVAMQDADAVRRALGAARVNLVGGSYGTRAVLEYQRQFPATVRRAVIDGVAPPDMVLPVAMSTDAQAALDQLLAACAGEPGCRQRWPDLAARWKQLLAGLPREVSVLHPLTGTPQKLTLTAELVLSLVRGPLYVPALAAALPVAIHEAAAGRFEALVGLSSTMSSRRGERMSEGMHFSVVCAEDAPRLAQASDAPGADFGTGMATMYRDVCSFWPRGEVPAAFYTMPPAPADTLVLSGGADPVTPPRHGQRTAQALGAKARHVVVAQAGHGVMALPCMRDVLFRFIDAESDDEALKLDAGCALAIPRPGAFVPPGFVAPGLEQRP